MCKWRSIIGAGRHGALGAPAGWSILFLRTRSVRSVSFRDLSRPQLWNSHVGYNNSPPMTGNGSVHTTYKRIQKWWWLGDGKHQFASFTHIELIGSKPGSARIENWNWLHWPHNTSQSSVSLQTPIQHYPNIIQQLLDSNFNSCSLISETTTF